MVHTALRRSEYQTDRPTFPQTEKYTDALVYIYEPWGEGVGCTGGKPWQRRFRDFMKSRYCPSSVKAGYLSAMDRFYDKNKRYEPKAKETELNQDMSQADRDYLDLMHLDVKEEESVIDRLDVGRNFDWSRSNFTVRIDHFSEN